MVAKADDEFHLEDLIGFIRRGVENKVLAENLTKVLYPNDNVFAGKEYACAQYFFVSLLMQEFYGVSKRNKDWRTCQKKPLFT